MPLIRISLSESYEPSVAQTVAEVVHNAMVETIDVPLSDRFATIRRCGEGEQIWDRTFLDVERSNRAIFVEITLSFGRNDDKKRALYGAIARNVEAAGIRPQDILVVLTETARANWSFGNGVAHYALAATES